MSRKASQSQRHRDEQSILTAEAKPKAPGTAELRDTALRYLAQREHSRQQLAQKLRRKFGAALAADAVDRLLNELAAEGLQSEQRFVEAKCRQRLSSGHGPLKIRADLAAAGVSGDLASAALESLDEDWRGVARELIAARFPNAHDDAREQRRCVRFLRSRGYTESVIRSVLLD